VGVIHVGCLDGARQAERDRTEVVGGHWRRDYIIPARGGALPRRKNVRREFPFADQKPRHAVALAKAEGPRRIAWTITALSVAIASAALFSVRIAAQDGGPRPPDLAGEWRLDQGEDPGQPPPNDYTGLAFNDAGRLRADTTPESIWGTPEYQCRPHSAPHQWRGVGGVRILKELDPISRDIVGFRLQFMRSLDRPIFFDTRPHPPAYAPHSWSGFSTAQWEGQTLKVITTHLKDGYLKRGGPQTSDMLTMTEYITRHDDIMTIVQVVDDPIYLDEPYVLSITYTYDPNGGPPTENC